MFLVLVTQQAKLIRRIVVFCGLFGSTIFYLISFKLSDFHKKNIDLKNVCFDFLYNSCLKYFSPPKNSEIYYLKRA